MLKELFKGKNSRIDEPKKTCSVKECYQDRASGDLLFCDKCREKWRKVCIQQRILEAQVDEGELNKFLREFQEEGLTWVV